MGFRVIGNRPAVIHLVRRSHDPDRSSGEIQTIAAKSSQLTEPQAREGLEEQHGAVADRRPSSSSMRIASSTTGRSGECFSPTP